MKKKEQTVNADTADGRRRPYNVVLAIELGRVRQRVIG